VLNVTDVVYYMNTNGFAAQAQFASGFKIDPIPNARVPADRNWVRYDDVYLAVR
jgi:hypothetical protein